MQSPFPDSIAANQAGWKGKLRLGRPFHIPLLLTRRQLYILPSRAGWGFAIVLLAMLTGSINYTLSLGFVLTFLLAGMGLVAMLHTWRNLAWLQIEIYNPPATFAGHDAIFPLSITDTHQRERHAIAARLQDSETLYGDIPANGTLTLALKLPAKKRGWLVPGAIKLHTGFPLGLFQVWSPLATSSRCLVYPKPTDTDLPIPLDSNPGNGGKTDQRSGDEDFAGLRIYQQGDSPRRIDWKASSREQGMFTKQFQAESQQLLWLDLRTTPGTDLEHRLSQLTRWIMTAHAQHQRYGLRLPGQVFPPDNSEAHYHQCLQALALMEPN
ncbi:DUF58 domain-containing protein [Methylobacillus caricis]|uniref:DUF58 domain-containing protein n=1 Tax=Methylobacillus caricis TaxID=1971611 RepID=UPI001CFFFCA6|nr:DUF58 domain-containing protein [Methylobacillus caricis]MCB5187080.1 DUF58 domain-containing protein [Methylobacillus caricis]